MTPLMYAVKESKTTFLERLIDLGSDVTIRNLVSFSNIMHMSYDHYLPTYIVCERIYYHNLKTIFMYDLLKLN